MIDPENIHITRDGVPIDQPVHHDDGDVDAYAKWAAFVTAFVAGLLGGVTMVALAVLW